MYSAYQLAPLERSRLLSLFPPRYKKVYAKHVTVQFGRNATLPPHAEKMEIIGRADDNHGLEALVIRINGGVKRPDGQIYHLTWSLNPDISPSFDIKSDPNSRYEPVDSNILVCGLIDSNGNPLPDTDKKWTFTPFSHPVLFQAEPQIRYSSSELRKKADSYTK